jgi:hypothetical protein
MTLGIIFREPHLDHRELRFTHDLSRLSQIDPELDLGIVQKLLVGIKEEVEQMSAGEKAFDIEEYTRFYLNDFCFSEIVCVKYDCLDNAIEQLVSIHM